MKTVSIKYNFIFNIILTLSSYIATILVFPYVSRVLGVEYIGIFGFINRTIDYFVLFSTLGISIIGVREIASCKDDIKKRSELFSSFLSLSLVLTFIIIVLYIIAVFSFAQLREHKLLFFIGLSKLFFSTLLIEWFYQGIENFRFISLRDILIKVIYVISVFLFVKEKDDYVLFFILNFSMVTANSLVNLYYSKHYIKFKFNLNRIKIYLKPIFYFGLYKIFDSMYSIFNVVMLGILCSDRETGYYYAANNLYYIVLGMFSALTRVMLPRMTALITDRKNVEFNNLIDKTFSIVFAFNIPIVIIGILLSPEIIQIMAGKDFVGAIIPLKIMMVLVFINSCAQIVVIQLLIPLHKDKVILFGSVIATVIALTLNYFFVKKYGAIGSSIILVVSVLCANVYPFYYAIKNKLLIFPVRQLFINLMYSIPYIIICVAIKLLFENSIIVLLFAGLISLIYFTICQWFYLKNEFVIGVLKSFTLHLHLNYRK